MKNQWTHIFRAIIFSAFALLIALLIVGILDYCAALNCNATLFLLMEIERAKYPRKWTINIIHIFIFKPQNYNGCPTFESHTFIHIFRKLERLINK